MNIKYIYDNYGKSHALGQMTGLQPCRCSCCCCCSLLLHTTAAVRCCCDCSQLAILAAVATAILLQLSEVDLRSRKMSTTDICCCLLLWWWWCWQLLLLVTFDVALVDTKVSKEGLEAQHGGSWHVVSRGPAVAIFSRPPAVVALPSVTTWWLLRGNVCAKDDIRACATWWSLSSSSWLLSKRAAATLRPVRVMLERQAGSSVIGDVD